MLADPGPEDLVLEPSLKYALIGGSKLVQEFKSEAGFFTFIPFERRLDVSVNIWFRLDQVLAHFDLLLRRSRTSKAERALDGFSR